MDPQGCSGIVKTKIVKDETSIIKRKNIEGDNSQTIFKTIDYLINSQIKLVKQTFQSLR